VLHCGVCLDDCKLLSVDAPGKPVSFFSHVEEGDCWVFRVQCSKDAQHYACHDLCNSHKLLFALNLSRI